MAVDHEPDGWTLTPPFLDHLQLHRFDSSKDGELKGSAVVDIVKARGNLRTVTASLPLPMGALVSVAVNGESRVEVEMSPDVYILRFGVGGRFRCEYEGHSPGQGRNILLSPGTHFHSWGRDESSLLFALHRRALDRALGSQGPPGFAIASLEKIGGPMLRKNAFTAARAVGRLPPELLPKYLRNFQNGMAAALAVALRQMQPEIRAPDPMIGRRKVRDLCEWAALDRAEPLTVGDLAAHCGFGLRALQKNFLLHFDTTPIAFLRELRLKKAHKLILSGAFSVTHAALEAGFVHLGHFSANYEKFFGELPSVTAATAARERA